MTARASQVGLLAGRYALWRDEVTGVVWAQDRTDPVLLTCHPYVHQADPKTEAERIADQGWGAGDRLVRVAGMVLNVEVYEVLNAIEREVGATCGCVGCSYRRDHAGRRVTVRRLLQGIAALHRKDLAGRHGGRVKTSGWAPASCPTCRVADAAARRHDLKLPSHEESTMDTEMEEP